MNKPRLLGHFTPNHFLFEFEPTDWKKPGIEPATPGLQDMGLSPTPRRLATFMLKTFIYFDLCSIIEVKLFQLQKA